LAYLDLGAHAGLQGCTEPVWLPDGKRVAFYAKGGAGHPQLHLAPFPPLEPTLETGEVVELIPGGAPRQITDGAGDRVRIAVNPEGNAVAYCVVVGEGRERVFLGDLAGEVSIHLADGGCPAWSPDGRRLYYGRAGEIHEVRLGGLDPRPLKLAAEVKGRTLAVSVENRRARPLTVTASYRLYDNGSFQVGSGPAGQPRRTLEAGGALDYPVELAAANRPGKYTVKLTVVTDNGERVVALADYDVKRAVRL